MKFSKKHYRRKMSRTDADIFAAKAMIDDTARGIEMPLSYYDQMSDQMCGMPSRKIYEDQKEE